MSILKSLGIDKYTDRFKRWIDIKLEGYVKKDELSITPVESITYSELINRRNNKQLVADNRYRIIDYITTTTQEETQSAGHQFDIIVKADAVDSINENATAILHDGDTYFSEAGSNLSVWELKYSLDNDTGKFVWADSQNGKGVIYYMKDEFDNECGYDFKNIQFKRYKIVGSEDLGYVGFKLDFCDIARHYFVGFDPVVNVYEIDENDYVWSYTFVDSNEKDSSTTYQDCITNTIKPVIAEGVRYLNDIVFRTPDTQLRPSWNIIKNDCFRCSFNGRVSFTTFSEFSYWNISINKISESTFDRAFVDNYFGNTVTKCRFGSGSRNNRFDGVVEVCEFGINLAGNSFNCNKISYVKTGTVVNNNKISGTFTHVIIGNQSFKNTFKDIKQCSFGEFCQYNNVSNALNCDFKFGFRYNTISNMKYCSGDVGFMYNRFKTTTSETGNDVGIENCRFGNYVWYNHFYSSSVIKNLYVQNGLSGSKDAYNYINIPENNILEIKVAKNSQGAIKIYCEADLIA